MRRKVEPTDARIETGSALAMAGMNVRMDPLAVGLDMTRDVKIGIAVAVAFLASVGGTAAMKGLPVDAFASFDLLRQAPSAAATLPAAQPAGNSPAPENLLAFAETDSDEPEPAFEDDSFEPIEFETTVPDPTPPPESPPSDEEPDAFLPPPPPIFEVVERDEPVVDEESPSSFESAAPEEVKETPVEKVVRNPEPEPVVGPEFADSVPESLTDVEPIAPRRLPRKVHASQPIVGSDQRSEQTIRRVEGIKQSFSRPEWSVAEDARFASPVPEPTKIRSRKFRAVPYEEVLRGADLASEPAAPLPRAEAEPVSPQRPVLANAEPTVSPVVTLAPVRPVVAPDSRTDSAVEDGRPLGVLPSPQGVVARAAPLESVEKRGPRRLAEVLPESERIDEPLTGPVRPRYRRVPSSRSGTFVAVPAYEEPEADLESRYVARKIEPVPVRSYDVETYITLEGDTFDRIGKSLFGSSDFGAALLEYNGFRVSRQEPLAPGLRVRIPPAHVLERKLAANPPAKAPEVSVRTRDVEIRQAKAFEEPEPMTSTVPLPVYRVREEYETLYMVARRTLGDGNRWKEIRDLNLDRIENEHVLPVGSELRLPPEARLDRTPSVPLP